MPRLPLDVLASASFLSPEDRRAYLKAMQAEANKPKPKPAPSKRW